MNEDDEHLAERDRLLMLDAADCIDALLAPRWFRPRSTSRWAHRKMNQLRIRVLESGYGAQKEGQ